MQPFWASTHDSYDNSGDNGSKGASSSRGDWGRLKDAKAYFKIHATPYISDKSIKRERMLCGNKNKDSWNKAKNKLTAEDFNKYRRSTACINCGEVDHTFYDCSKPKP